MNIYFLTIRKTGLLALAYLVTMTIASAQTVHNSTQNTFHFTIQDAVNSANLNDVIELTADITEGLVNINEAITLEGNNWTLTSSSATYGLYPTVAGVTIQNITVEDAGSFGIHASCGTDNLSLTNVTVDNSGGTGITINGSDNCLLTNITSTNNGGNGLSFTNCDNMLVNGLTTSGNMFVGGFNAGIGLFTTSAYCLPAGINGFTLTGTVSINETTKMYSQKETATDPIIGISGATIGWAVGIGSLDRSYWVDKPTAYGVVDALFEPPYSYPNTAVYVADVATEDFYVDDDPNGDNSPPMLVSTAIALMQPGKKLFLEAGTFSENIVVNKALDIRGANYNVNCASGRAPESIITGTGASGTTTVSITADNVSLNGLTISNPLGSYGVAFTGRNNIDIRYNIITDIGNAVNGSGPTHAVSITMGSGANMDNVDVSENCFNDLRGGENTSLTGAAAKANNGSVSAITAGFSTANFDITNLTITNNLIDNVTACDADFNDGGKGAYGILINVGANVANNGKAISPIITGNEVTNLAGHWSHGIGLEGETPGAQVLNNLISNLTDTKPAADAAGVMVEQNDGAATVDIHDNSFTSMELGVRNVTAITVDAECNWYGTAAAPGVVAMNEGPVDYTPWRTDGADGPGRGFQPTGGCTGTPVVITSTTPDHIICGDVDGSIEIAFSGGSSQYSVTWSGPSPGLANNISSPHTIMNLSAGAYAITVTDMNGSTATSTATVEFLPVTNVTDAPDTYYATIQAAVNAADPGETIEVCAGNYNEDVLVNKQLTIIGAGIDQSIVVGQIGGESATFRLASAGSILEGFTITRVGNTLADWNNALLNSAGVAIQTSGGMTVRECKMIGNRTGIDINNSNGNTIDNNIITQNHTGVIFRNQTDNTLFRENEVVDNRTAGVLFLAASLTGTPPQQALNCQFNDNTIHSNWYGQIVDRQTGGFLPLPGANPKNFECNWYGSASPSVSTANSAEPAYALLIPTYYGGTATPPGGQPDILGPASANFDYISFLVDGTDDDGVEIGFQPVAGSCIGTPVVISGVTQDPVTCGETTGELTVTFSGGTPDYTFDWTGGGSASGIMASPFTITGLLPGSYTITVTDDNGTTATTVAVVDYLPVTNVSDAPDTYYATIQAAINAADAGEQITLCAGTYIENVIVDEQVTITGAGQVNTFVKPAISGPVCSPGSICPGSSNVFLVRAHNVTIEQLTVDGDNPSLTSGVVTMGADLDARNGIITDHTMGVLNNLNVNNVTVTNIYLRGIYASSGGTFNFSNNTANNVQGELASIAMMNFGGSGSFTGNTVTHSNDGIVSNWSTGTTYTNNTVSQCGSGIHTDNNSAGVADVIQGNTVMNGSGSSSYGIFVFNPYHNVMVTNNTVTNVHVGMACTGSLSASPTITFSGNTINGMGLANSTGMYPTTQVWGYGDGNADIVFTNNFVTNTTDDAFFMEASATFTLDFTANNNSITGNASGVTMTGTGTIAENFTCNWWGSAASGAVAAAAAYSTNFDPWLIIGTDDQPGTPGFQPVSGACAGTPVVITSTTITDAACTATGSIQVAWSGGTGPYDIAWTGGSDVGVTSAYNITGLTTGNYGITVTDANGSTGTSNVTVGFLPVSNTTLNLHYATIQAAINGANNNDVIEVCAGTFTEAITINKPLIINGPNQGTPGTGVRVAEAQLLNCDIDMTAATGTITLDGFQVYQTNTILDVILISGGTTANILNSIIERWSPTTGDGVRAITTSSGSGVKTIQDNLFRGDASGGLFSGHRTWNSAMYINGASSSVNILDNTFLNSRTALNIDDYQAGINLSGNTFNNCGTFISFGGTVPTMGSYVLGANEFQTPGSAIINLSNVNVNFRLDITSSTFGGSLANTLPLATRFLIESGMFHRGRSGRNGLVTYVAGEQYVVAGLTTIQSAVDYATAGDIININTGSYPEQVTVDLPVTIDGGTALCGDVIIEGGSTRLFGVRVLAGVHNVTLRDFKVQNTVGTNAGIWAATNNNGLNLQHLCLENTAGLGAILAQGPVNGVTINDCEVWGAGVNGRGIVIWDGFKQNVSITNNYVHDISGCCGIELQDGNASGVTMTGNTVENTGDSGMSAIGLNESVGNNSISNNTITNTGRFGIEIKNPDGSGNTYTTIVSGNIVDMDMTDPSSPANDVKDFAGIAIFRRAVGPGNTDIPMEVSVTGNSVSNVNQPSTSEGFGILIEGIGHTVTGNTLTGCDVGIQQQAGHLPYPGDGNDADVADTYFGRGNTQQTCSNSITGNTFLANGTDTRDVGLGGGLVTNTISGEVFCSIQDAIDDAQTMDGHTLTVGAGTYNEHVVITKQLTINGAGSGNDPMSNTVLSAPASCSGAGITISASNVSVTGFHVVNYYDGIVVNTSNNTQIDNVEVLDACHYGLSLNGTLVNIDVINSEFTRTTIAPATVGIRVGTGTGVNDFRFENSVLSGWIQGVYIANETSPGGPAFTNVLFKNSNISGNTQKGMYFEKLSNALFDGLTMDNNGTDPLYGFNNGIDINLKWNDFSDITIQNCDITNSGVTGIAADPQNPAAIAIKARDDASSYNSDPATLDNVLIKNNRITGPQNGLRIGEFGKINLTPTDLVIEGNDLSFGFGHKAIISRINADINLDCNWHGTTNLATILGTMTAAGAGDLLLNDVLNSGIDGNPAVGFQPSGTCTCPNGNLVTRDSDSQTFCSIQAAIDDAGTVNGDILYVGAGLYIENVIVDKQVSILGPNESINPCMGGRVPEAVVVPSSAAISSGEIFHIAASNVTISGLLIDGDNTAITSGYTSTNGADIDAAEGITVYETGVNNLTVTNNILQNLSYFGVTLYDYPAAVPSSGHLIHQNLIQDMGTYDAGSGINYWGGGVLLYNNQYAAVTDNCMENVRIGVQTGNFHQANPGGPASQVISGNSMEVRRRGIFHNLHYSNASGYTLSDNNITGLADANETVWDGILLASLSVPSSSINNTINGAGISNPSEGYEVWNVKSTTPASISGGSVSNVLRGLFLNNYDGYASNAGDGAHATVSGLAIAPSATGIGIYLKDNTLSTGANVQLGLGSGVTVNGGATGLRVEESSASVSGGTLNDLSFTGTTDQYIELVANGNDLDGTAASFDGVTGLTASLAQLFAIEDKIHHEIEDQSLGFVTVKATNAYVTDILTPAASNNDYTRVRNAIELIGNGWTVNLNGSFDWTEVNAAASWALGNDETSSTLDDYSLYVQPNLNGVTFTAPLGLGTASIQGPGDLAGVNLEGVFFFNGGDNQNWTISNMELLDFDLAIGMFNGAGGSDAYNGLTITNNQIDIATDLNATVAPGDVNQNIGIHYSFGANQTISNNIINIAGDGVSDGLNFSTSVGMQSNTSGGSVYDGLLITGNTINVLQAQSANPQVILGIWENAHGHTANITVSNNQFLNLSGGNNPALNLQRAFRVTSHSGAGSTVAYSGNTVEGANIGFQWIAASNFAAHNPVQLTGNAISEAAIGVLLQSNGKALFTNNDFDAVADNARDLQIQAGSIATSGGGNQWAGDEYYVENLSSSPLDITGESFDQVNAYRRTDRMYGALDNASSGLIRFDGINLYVSAPGTGLSDETIPNAIAAAAASGDVIHIETGSYTTGLDATTKEVAVAPGSSPGCVTLAGDMTLTSGDDLIIEINGLTPCTQYDRFTVNGMVTLGGADLVATLGYTPSNFDEIPIILNDGVDPVSGQFSQGLSIMISGYPFVINYAGGDGNDVVLQMCTGMITITTPPVSPQNTPNIPATVPDQGPGATYVWALSSGMITSGQGTSSILYTTGPAPSMTVSVTVTDFNGCVSTGSVVVNLIAAGPSTMQWVPDNAAHGSCPGTTNCCSDVICFGLQYTPGVSGNLTSYTTGFFSNCLGGVNPIVSNQSCVMNNNSGTIDDCINSNTLLFNSSGNSGAVPVSAGVPVILHKVCFNLSTGETLTISEDVITNLSASIDLTGGGQFTEFPTYSTQNLTKPAPVMPPNDGDVVECESQAVAPVTPVVVDYCGNIVPPGIPLITNNINPLTCEGTIIYTYTYTDCSGYSQPWVFTYTVDDTQVPTASNPATVNVECFSLIPAVDVSVVTDEVDNCTAVPTVTWQSDNITSAICDGATVTVLRTYRITDCAGNYTDVVQTINVDDMTNPTASNPLDINVECFSDIPAPNVGVVTDEDDNCDGAPTVTHESDNILSAICDGATVTVIRTYRVTDCSGNFIFVTQNINVDDVTNPTASNPAPMNVECFSDIPMPDVTVVTDEADNCDGVPVVSYIGQDISSVVCDGASIIVTRTYRVTDCSGNFIDVLQTINVNDVTPPAEVGGPVSTASTIACGYDAIAPANLPVVIDVCGVTLAPTPASPVVGGTWPQGGDGCAGTITYTYTYESCSGLQFVWVYTYTVDCEPLNLKVFLEGPFDSGTNTMVPDLNINHVLPGQDKAMSPSLAVQLGAPYTPFGQPYTVAPWNYSGNLGLNYGDPTAPGAPGGVIPYPSDVVDWVLVTIRKNGITPPDHYWTCAGWVHTDGDVSFPESCGPLSFNPADDYYVLVQHRNHLGVLSPVEALMPCAGITIAWDFTTSNSYQPLFRYGQKQIGTKWVMHAANGDQLTSIAAISSPDRTTWRLLQNALGYGIGDYNMDVSTDSADETVWKFNQNRTSGILFY